MSLFVLLQLILWSLQVNIFTWELHTQKFVDIGWVSWGAFIKLFRFMSMVREA